jgi:hypothetical protein
MDTKIDDHILQHLHQFALRALPGGAGETNGKGSKMSQASGLLSHTQLNSLDTAIAREYPIVPLEEVKDAMDNAWHLFLTWGVTSLKPRIELPLHSDVTATELWHTKSRKLKDIWSSRSSCEAIRRELPGIRDMVVEAVDEMNSVTVTFAQPPAIAQSKDSHAQVYVYSLYYSGATLLTSHSKFCPIHIRAISNLIFYRSQQYIEQTR